VTQAAILCAMAVLDVSLAGVRSIAGRDAHIDKGALFRRWTFRGAVVGVGALVAIAAMLVTALARAEDQAMLYDDLIAAGTRMLAVFVPFTLVLLVALVAYVVPNLEARCLALVIVLGPLTMARAGVLLTGAFAAAWTAPPVVQVAAFATVAIVVLAEALLHRWAAAATGERSWLGSTA